MKVVSRVYLSNSDSSLPLVDPHSCSNSDSVSFLHEKLISDKQSSDNQNCPDSTISHPALDSGERSLQGILYCQLPSMVFMVDFPGYFEIKCLNESEISQSRDCFNSIRDQGGILRLL